MNRALGMFEAQSKLWRLASMAQSSGAPVSKWATREIREGQLHVWFHCVGIRVSDQLERLLWRSVPHIIVTSATLRSLNSFSRLQEMSGLKKKPATALWRWIRRLIMWNRETGDSSDALRTHH